jgi:regulatory protein
MCRPAALGGVLADRARSANRRRVSTSKNPLEIAARALRHRDRSRREIDDRLAKAGVEDTERADALEALERVGYVDDERFAALRSAALAGRGYGDEWIRHDLSTHGIGGEACDEALAMLQPEAERAVALAERLGRSAKTAAHLARKGFGEDAIQTAFPEIAADTG